MKRMTCIGAQSVAVSESTALRPGVEMPCRRDSGDGQQRTFVVAAHPFEDAQALSVLQLPLFEEPAADAR